MLFVLTFFLLLNSEEIPRCKLAVAPTGMSMNAREARIYSARFVITLLGRSIALVFLQIFPIFAAKTALLPVPCQAPRFHVNKSALPKRIFLMGALGFIRDRWLL